MGTKVIMCERDDSLAAVSTCSFTSIHMPVGTLADMKTFSLLYQLLVAIKNEVCEFGAIVHKPRNILCTLNCTIEIWL